MQPLNINTLKIKGNVHRPLIFNSVLWILSFLVLLFIFSKGTRPIIIDYIYTSAFIVFITIPVSINFYVLIPRFLKLEKYGTYIILFLANLLGFSLLYQLIFKAILNAIFPNYFFISYVSDTNAYIIFIIFLLATTLVKLAEDWFYFNAQENKTLKLRNTLVETQLSALRAQINPHFLFNSLNVIYAMALEKNREITKAIVQLSDILRYVIYDSDTERVTLKQEIELLKNYIAFQNHRTQNSEFVHFHCVIDNENFKIYPMLLLPLLENSFKYGYADDDDEASVNIELIQKKQTFQFKISNKNKSYTSALDENYSGVGLKNLRNNLNLVYPNTHAFLVEDTPRLFTVSITIHDDKQ